MNSLRRLSSVAVLTFVFSISVLAGDINTPPCASPEPGETHTPPCFATGQTAAPGQTDTPPAADTMSILSVTEAAMDLMLLF